MSSTGLRSRKKERTRAEIVRVARELFTERGYDATTIADIAEGVDIATSTIFGYFATKDEILFSHHQNLIPDEREWLAARAGTKPAIELIRDYLVHRLPELLPEEATWQRTLRKIVDADPHLVAQEYERLRRYQEVFAEAIARDIGCRPDDFRCQLAAAATLSAYFEAGRAIMSGSTDRDDAYDTVLAFLGAGNAAMCAQLGRRA
jgi:AcrR family transcriptional regulator